MSRYPKTAITWKAFFRAAPHCLLALWAIVFFLLLFHPWAQAAQGASAAPVWNAEHDWLETVPGTTETWEDKYSQWVQTDVNEKIFTSPESPLYGIPTLCDDAVYAIRLLFAYENHLPFIIHGAHGFITNKMQITGNTPGQRLTNFVKYTLTQVSVDTLSRDSYPISIDRDNVRPGSILLFLDPHNNMVRHSFTLHDVSDTGVPVFLNSTEPQIVRDLAVTQGIKRAPFSQGLDGLREWHHYYCSPKTSAVTTQNLFNCDPAQDNFSVLVAEPGSKESFASNPKDYVDQYKMVDPNNLMAWGESVIGALSLIPEDPHVKLRRLSANVCDSIQQRVENINQAASWLKSVNGRCANGKEWESYSTPSLDKDIWTQLKSIDQFISQFCDDDDSCKEMLNERDENFGTSACTVFAGTPQQMNLTDLRRKFKHRLVSADPNDSFEQKWDINPDDPKDSLRIGVNKKDPNDMIWPATYDDTPISYGCRSGASSSSHGFSASPQRAQ